MIRFHDPEFVVNEYDAEITRLRTMGRIKHVYMVDPSLFTIPYDSLTALGISVQLFGRPLRPTEISADGRFAIRPYFYRLSDRLPPGFVRLLFKAIDHVFGMTRLALRVAVLRPDVVHFQWSAAPIVDAIAFRAMRCFAPVVLTVHDSEPFNGKASSRFQMLGHKGLVESADALIVHTSDAKRRLIELGLQEARISVVKHGLLGAASGANVPRPRDSGGKLKLLLFGKLKAYKGIDVLIEALGIMPAHLRRAIDVRIVGEPFFDLNGIRERIATLELHNCVSITEEYVADDAIPELIQWADVLLFPYRQIDASGVLFTALNYRKPFVAARLGAFVDIADEFGNGVLVDATRADLLAKALTAIAEDENLVERLSAAARSVDLAKFTWKAIAQDTLRIYESAG